MQFLISHIEHIIAAYDGQPPLAIFLKQYFRQHARLGARDRKAITEAVYIYYRCAAFSSDTEIQPVAVIARGLDWCGSLNQFLRKILADTDKTNLLPDLATAGKNLEFSDGLARETWLQSMLSQPDLFIRLRKRKDAAIEKLRQAGIPFKIYDMPALGKSCIAVPNGTKADQLPDEQDYLVQDMSSQLSLQAAMQHINTDLLQHDNAVAWDVCSGAGDKTLLFKDMFPQIPLYATDVRESILHNLRVRIRQAGLKGVETISMNAADRHELKSRMPDTGFDFIICDVPCSGSGTWARTPEQFYFFKETAIADFSALQFAIAANAAERPKQRGILCYITCSVFLQENEGVTDQLAAQKGLNIRYRQLINGIPHKADCMYVAVLEKL